MKISKFFPWTILVAILIVASNILSCKKKPDKQPNIVLCMADDQGWGDMGYYGHAVLKTPNFDALAREGIVLNICGAVIITALCYMILL